MALSDIIKVKIRDHLGYGVAGLYAVSPAGGSFAVGQIGYRFFQAYGHLEYRLNNMSPNEEAMITGSPVGAFAIMGTPTPGDTFTVNLSGGGLTTPASVSVTAAAGDQNFNIAAKLAVAISNNAACQAAGFRAVALYGTGPFSPQTTVPLPEVAVIAGETFSMNVSATSSAAAQVTNTGQAIGPQASLDGINTLVGYVPICDALKGAVASASQNFDTRQADVWKGRSSEMALRVANYQAWRQQLADFLGPDIKLGPAARRTFRHSRMLRYL